MIVVIKQSERIWEIEATTPALWWCTDVSKSIQSNSAKHRVSHCYILTGEKPDVDEPG